MDTHRIIQAIDHTNLDPCATEEEILAFAAAAQGTDWHIIWTRN